MNAGVLIRGEPSPVPMCPSGRILACPERAWMRLPSPEGWASSNGGFVASPVHYSNVTQNVAYPFSQSGASKSHLTANGKSALPPVTALSIEFVAKPEEAHRVQASIPAAIAGALKDVNGFAGCLVMVSDHEARLVTVVTLWAGSDRARCCSQNVRWVHALLKPYLDRCLRVQTMVAHLPVLPLIDFLPVSRLETNAVDECSMIHHQISTDETVCAA